MSSNQSEEELKELVFIRLQHSLQALSLPADVQLSLEPYPNFSYKVDELALEFDQWCLCTLTNYGSQLLENQKFLLQTLDNELSKMSDVKNKNLWTEEALKINPEWDYIREVAKEALISFGWKSEKPLLYGKPL